MVYPVRALWEAANEADRQRAQRLCVSILELWLGKLTKAQVAERLQQPPLRIWQLSQRALSGMLAALVHQPRTRVPQGVVMPNGNPDELKALRKENAELKKRLKVSEELNEILRCLPPPRSTPVAPKRKPSHSKVRQGATGPRGRPRRSKTDRPSSSPPDRPAHP